MIPTISETPAWAVIYMLAVMLCNGTARLKVICYTAAFTLKGKLRIKVFKSLVTSFNQNIQ